MDVIERVKILYSLDGYFTRFFEIIYETECRTYTEAYLALEDEFKDLFGQNRYATYQSFKNAKSRYLKTLNKTKVTGSYLN